MAGALMKLRTKKFQLMKKQDDRHTILGTEIRFKSIFRDREPEGRDGIEVYTEHPPPSLPDPKDQQRLKDAIHAYYDTKYRPYIGYDREQQVLQKIKIQNSFLRNELKPLLEPYEIEHDNGCPVVQRPFMPIYFAREQLAEKLEKHDKESHEYKLIEFIVKNILNGELWTTIKEAQELGQDFKISWKYLWTLFPCDSIVIARSPEGHEQAYQVNKLQLIDAHESTPYLNVTCQYIQFDGHRFGFIDKTFSITPFRGTRSVTDLPVYPLRLARRGDTSDGDNLRQTLHERGAKVLNYQHFHHVQIKPMTLDKDRENYDELLQDLGRKDVHGNAIVDFYTAARRNEKWRHGLRPLYDHQYPFIADSNREPNVEEAQESSSGSSTRPRRNEGYIGPLVEDSLARPDQEAQQQNKDYVMMEKDNLVLMNPLLHAFSLETKQWVSVNVDSVVDIDFKDETYSHLVADEGHKSLLVDLVESQKCHSQGLEDPVHGKGKGLLILLSGPPGTGKTLMAEAIAERARRSLYYVDARDLGDTYESISKSFKRIMEDSCQWGSIVLLDEADTYLQKRSPLALESNERTAAFLRHLEYFQGILFMTTNLVETLDEAIESRFHIHLSFNHLIREHREKIWNQFLARTKDLDSSHDLSAVDVERLSAWVLNGRQIKNAYRMALAISRYKKQPISIGSLEDIIPLSCHKAVREKDPQSSYLIDLEGQPTTPAPQAKDKNPSTDALRESPLLNNSAPPDLI